MSLRNAPHGRTSSFSHSTTTSAWLIVTSYGAALGSVHNFSTMENEWRAEQTFKQVGHCLCGVGSVCVSSCLCILWLKSSATGAMTGSTSILVSCLCCQSRSLSLQVQVVCPPIMTSAAAAPWLCLQLEDIGARVFFEKQLTSSDVSASGRVVVPKVCCKTSCSCCCEPAHARVALTAAPLQLLPLLAAAQKLETPIGCCVLRGPAALQQ